MAAERDNKAGSVNADERRVILLKCQNMQLAKKVELYREVTQHQKQTISETMNAIEEMQSICKEWAIKDDRLAKRMSALKARYENSLKQERSLFNSQQPNDDEEGELGQQ